jgi:hypothetical protein
MGWGSGSGPRSFAAQRPDDTQKTGSWLGWLGYRTGLNGKCKGKVTPKQAYVALSVPGG